MVFKPRLRPTANLWLNLFPNPSFLTPEAVSLKPKKYPQNVVKNSELEKECAYLWVQASPE